MLDLAIIGGGIAGLSAAYFAEQQGLSWQLFESEDQVGGAIQTREINGYIVENGPNFFSLNESLLEIIQSLGLERELRRVDKQTPDRFIGSGIENGELKFKKAPLSPGQFLTSSLLSPTQKLRALAEPFISSNQFGYEDMGTFISRRFGRAFYDNILSAVLTGIYGSEPSRLNPEYVLESIFNLTRNGKSILLNLPAVFRGIKARRGDAPRGVFTLVGGISQITSSLSGALISGESGQRISTRSKIVRVGRIEGGYAVQVFSANETEQTINTRRIIYTADNLNATNIFAELGLTLPKITYLPLTIHHCAVDRSNLGRFSNALGLLVPPRLNSSLLGTLFMSNVSPERAPAGKALLTCFCTESAGIEEIVDHLKLIFKATVDQRVEHVASHSWPRAIPQYREGHSLLLQNVSEFEQQAAGISLIGSWVSGLSLRDRVLAAKRVVGGAS